MITNAIVAGIKADLDNITFNNNLLVFLMGDTVIGDTECRVYGFDSSSSATPDGNFVIRPSMYASTNGRLLRRDWNQYYNDIRFKSITYTPSALEITTALGYTPVTNGRTITINGVALDLSANRSWSVGDLLSSGSYADPSWITSLAWSKITGAPSSSVTSVFGRTGAVIAVNGDYTTTQVTEGTNLYYTNARSRNAITLTTTGTSGNATYNSTSGVLNIPNYTYPSVVITSPTRTLNSNFTISATKTAEVTYTVTCSVTNPLIAGSSTANAYLEYSLNNGSTWTLVSQTGNSSSVGVAVAISIMNGQTSVLSGSIPINALVRIRTVTTGTASVTLLATNEAVEP